MRPDGARKYNHKYILPADMLFPLDKTPVFAVSYMGEKTAYRSEDGSGRDRRRAGPKGKRKNSQAEGSDPDEAPERKGIFSLDAEGATDPGSGISQV